MNYSCFSYEIYIHINLIKNSYKFELTGWSNMPMSSIRTDHEKSCAPNIKIDKAG
jgi:hypothetical protein